VYCTLDDYNRQIECALGKLGPHYLDPLTDKPISPAQFSVHLLGVLILRDPRIDCFFANDEELSSNAMLVDPAEITLKDLVFPINLPAPKKAKPTNQNPSIYKKIQNIYWVILWKEKETPFTFFRLLSAESDQKKTSIEFRENLFNAFFLNNQTLKSEFAQVWLNNTAEHCKLLAEATLRSTMESDSPEDLCGVALVLSSIKNPSAATTMLLMKFLKEAADKDHVLAAYMLAEQYRNSFNKQNFHNAFSYYEFAASKGHVASMLALATLFSLPTPFSCPELCAKYLILAAEEGDETSQKIVASYTFCDSPPKPNSGGIFINLERSKLIKSTTASILYVLSTKLLASENLMIGSNQICKITDSSLPEFNKNTHTVEIYLRHAALRSDMPSIRLLRLCSKSSLTYCQFNLEEFSEYLTAAQKNTLLKEELPPALPELPKNILHAQLVHAPLSRTFRVASSSPPSFPPERKSKRRRTPTIKS